MWVLQVCRGTNESDKEYKRVGERGTTQVALPTVCIWLGCCACNILNTMFHYTMFF
ncbi:hypothetical protein HHE02_15790 [Helicobacter heilmannii]|nr:hypothetical protein HHE02_15790 [Helicobacter heilmannii]